MIIEISMSIILFHSNLRCMYFYIFVKFGVVFKKGVFYFGISLITEFCTYPKSTKTVSDLNP